MKNSFGTFMRFRSILLSLTFCLSFALVSRADDFSSVAATSYDGSLWVAGENGILRVGRNGRVIRYDEGDIGTAAVTSIVSDSSGTIWILGGDGVVRSYSFLDGFVPCKQLPSGVCALASDLTGGKLYASTSRELYSWSAGVSPQKISDLESPISSICFAPDGAIWLVGQSALYRMENGSSPIIVSSPESMGNVSKSITFEIETNAHSAPSGHVFYVILIIILALVLACVCFFLIRRSSSRNKSVIIAPGRAIKAAVKPVEKPTEATPKESLPESVSTPAELFPKELNNPGIEDDFVTQVKQIIEDNISTQKFGVDEIAEITGMSRIHVNRKLKAAGCPSPSVMLKEARMKKAAQLVTDGVLSFQEIAIKCGFSSASYFTTAFRDYFGVTPSEYNSK